MASDDIIPVKEEEEPVVCLLNRLKCPRESDLACKRKVQTNPCKGVKRNKGATSFEPLHRKFLSINEFPDQPNWSKVCKILLLLQPSSAASEHVFSNSLSIRTIRLYRNICHVTIIIIIATQHNLLTHYNWME